MNNVGEDSPKSMRLFFIDNQGAWEKGAKLVGDLVVWPDQGQYPTYSPVAVAEHPNFDGKIVMHAGNRGLVLTFVQGAKTTAEVRHAISKGKSEQYRIAVDALIHRMVLWLSNVADGVTHDEVDALSLAAWMAASTRSRPYARVVMEALNLLMKDPEALTKTTALIRKLGGPKDADAFSMADALHVSMVQSMAAKDVAHVAPTPLRRPNS